MPVTLYFNKNSYSISEITNANSNNATCYLNQKLSEHIQKTSKTPRVLVACFEQGGFGDLVLGIKFAKYIINSFDIKLDIITANFGNKKSFEFIRDDFLNDGILAYSQDFRKSPTSTLHNPSGYVSVYNLIAKDYYNLTFDSYEIYDIIFIAPDVKTIGIELNGNHAKTNHNNFKNNSYTLSEYNLDGGHYPFSFVSGIPETTVNTGPNTPSKELGITLDNYDKFFPLSEHIKVILQNRRFSISYFYTDKQTVYSINNEMDKKGYFKDRNDASLWETCKCFWYYLEDLKKMRLPHENLVILAKSSIIEDLKYFLKYEVVHYLDKFRPKDKNMYAELELFFTTEKWIDNTCKNKSGIQIIQFCRQSKSEMLALYQRSLPTVFISGDQSITDFISVNTNFNHRIYYQILNWKKNLAKALKTKNPKNGKDELSFCGVIEPSELNTIKKDPNYDFRFRGLKIIESLLIFSLYNKCPSNSPQFSIKFLSSFSKNEATIIKSMKNHNLSLLYKISPGLTQQNYLIYQLNDTINYKFIIDFLVNKIEYFDNNNAIWYKGSENSNISISQFPYSKDVAEKNNQLNTGIILLPFQKNGNSILFSQQSAVLYLCDTFNKLNKSDKYHNHFIYTFATLNSNCFSDNRNSLTVFKDSSSISMSLSNLVNNPKYWNIENSINIILQVMIFLKKLAAKNLYYNGISLDSILIKILPSEILLKLDSHKILTNLTVNFDIISDISWITGDNNYSSNPNPNFDIENIKNKFLNQLSQHLDITNEQMDCITKITDIDSLIEHLNKMRHETIPSFPQYKLLEYPATDFKYILAEKVDLIQHIIEF